MLPFKYEIRQLATRLPNGLFCLVLCSKVEVLLRKNKESAILKENQVFITEPVLISMETENGAKLMGVQINTRV